MCLFIKSLIKTDHGHENHDEEKKHEHTFNEDAEKMVKSVKQALENGEGCRVSYSYTGSHLFYRMVFQVVIVNCIFCCC